ncbi:diacylglycerol kinase family protein [Microgenomates group bacterium]|nr:diacylglycerol kinase family protein [Microgenomates group bacterium]
MTKKGQVGPFSLFKSFRAAAAGLGQTLRTEQNMRFHLLATVIILACGWWVQLSPVEWSLIILCCVAVMGVELLNTAIEYLCDIVRDKMRLNYQATKIPRDMAAAAVLIVSMGAAAVGLIIFLPKFF